MSVKDEIVGLVDQAREEARAEARAEMRSVDHAAASVAMAILADVVASSAQRVRQHNPGMASFLEEQAKLYLTVADPPRVASTSPREGATAAPAQQIALVFENPIDEASLDGENIHIAAASGGPHLAATISYDAENKTAWLAPEKELRDGVTYRVTVGGVRNRAGGEMAEPLQFEIAAKGESR